MATQGYGTSPGRTPANAVGTSLPRSVTTKPVPLILSAMKTPVKGKSK
jgi:hypothetical protein